MSEYQVRRRVTAALSGVVLVASASGLAAVPSFAAADTIATCPAQSINTTPVSQISRGAHRVVLVHGWTGRPLHDTAGLLGPALGSGWQVFLFDYHDSSNQWAAVPQIAACLADYIAAVSAYQARDGDGKVYLVGHSMGGLAARFAASPTWGGKPVSSLIGGVVTLDIPHAGTPWGNTPLGLLKEAFSTGIPNPFSDGTHDASKCLAVQHAGADMQQGCDPPPYLAKSIPITEIAGSLTVRRSLFGIHQYDITMGGDTIVPLDSEAGYLGSAAGGRNATVGSQVHFIRIDCSIDSERAIGYAAQLGAARLSPKLGQLVARLDNDSAAMDAIGNQAADPALLQFMALANFTGDCAHGNITHSKSAIAAVADALRGDAAGRGVTKTRLANLTLPAGHSCEYASDLFKGPLTLVNGKTEDPGRGFIETGKILLADVDGDGSTDGLAQLICSSGAGGTSSLLALLTAKSGRTVEVPYEADAERTLPGLSVYRIYDMTISGSTLRIRASGHRPNDTICCPSAVVDITYNLGSGGLRFESAEVI